MEAYYLHFFGSQQGPFSLESIQQMWKEAKIPANATYWNESSQAWEPVLELLSGSYQSVASPPLPSSLMPPASNPRRRARIKSVLPPERPMLISILAGLGVLGSFLGCFFVLFIPPSVAEQLPPEFGGRWFPLIIFGVSLVSLITWIGIWKMRRWGVYLYVAVVVVAQVVSVVLELWRWYELIGPAVILTILVWHFPDMR